MRKQNPPTGLSCRRVCYMVSYDHMKVIGIDPGYDRLGVAIIEKVNNRENIIFSTCIETNKEATLANRLHELGAAFDTLLQEHNPDVVGIETLFFNKNVKTAIGVAQARGIILYLAQTHNAKVCEYGPQEIKTAVTGYGKSDKTAVIDMVKRLADNVPEDALDDEYDAIAVAITTLANQR